MVQLKFFVEKTTLANLEAGINKYLQDNAETIEYVDLKFVRPHATPATAILIYKTV